MKWPVELLRWTLTVVFGALAICILIGICTQLTRSGFHTDSLLVAILSLLWTVFPTAFAYLAYTRRWRELVFFPMIVLTVFA